MEAQLRLPFLLSGAFTPEVFVHYPLCATNPVCLFSQNNFHAATALVSDIGRIYMLNLYNFSSPAKKLRKTKIKQNK
jgi:hypothetical protein